MPGPASHLFIASKIAESYDDISDAEIKNLISGENEKYYKMGSTGPDLWFFAPDYPIIEYMEVLLEFLSKIALPIKDLYEDTIEPVVDAIGDVTDGVETVLDTATCDSISSIQTRTDHISELFSESLNSVIVHIFTKSINTFDLMRAEAQKGNNEDEWFWFDILHSRRSGQFLNEMWSLSDTDKKKAYVLGYASHVAADVTGHPYINQAVGGPGRSHNQRHHFVENVLDVWYYDHEITPSVNIADSKLHLDLPYGEELDEEGILFSVMGGLAREKNDLTEIFTMVSQSMDNVFPIDERPNKLVNGITSSNDINLAYWFLLASFKISTDSFIPKPTPPLDGILDAINDAMEEFYDTVSHPPSAPNSPGVACFALWSSDCDFTLDAMQDWLEYMWDNIVYLTELVNWAAAALKDLFDVLACTITAPIKATVSALLWIIQSSLYNILEEVRHALALGSFVHPRAEWVNTNPIAREFIELSDRSKGDFIKRQYPHRAQESNEGFLKYPQTPVEGKPTLAGPYPEGSNPSEILTGIGTEFSVGDALYKKYEESLNPTTHREIEFSEVEKQTFPAIPLARKLFSELMGNRKIPDWNLDADRGYQYKNWIADWTKLAWDEINDVDDSWHIT